VVGRGPTTWSRSSPLSERGVDDRIGAYYADPRWALCVRLTGRREGAMLGSRFARRAGLRLGTRSSPEVEARPWGPRRWRSEGLPLASARYRSGRGAFRGTMVERSKQAWRSLRSIARASRSGHRSAFTPGGGIRKGVRERGRDPEDSTSAWVDRGGRFRLNLCQRAGSAGAVEQAASPPVSPPSGSRPSRKHTRGRREPVVELGSRLRRASLR